MSAVIYDIIIIGAGPAGMTSALYALRAGKSVLVIEKTVVGGQITYAPHVENYPGVKEMSGASFADTLFGQITELGAAFEYDTVTGIEIEDGVKIVHTESGDYRGKSVIIAVGLKHRKLGLENEEALTGSGVSYCAVCDGAFFAGRPVAVVGGGSTALQDALLLSNSSSQVYLIHRRWDFRGEDKLVERIRERGNIALVLNSEVTAIDGQDALTGLRVKNRETGEETALKVEGLFIAVGYIPQNAAFSSVAGLDENGYFTAGENCRGSVPGVFVAGDCRSKETRQLTTAVSDGASAALAACDYVDSMNF